MSERNRTTQGTVVWHELSTVDPEGACAFYGELFGWAFHKVDLGVMGPYTTIAAEGTDIGGIAPTEGTGQSQWVPYFEVADVDASAKRVPGLGGRVQVPPTEIPQVGRFALIQDRSGATLALFRRG